MSWDFETEPEFQKELEWIERFVREEVEPLDLVLGNPYDVRDAKRNALVRPLQAEVKRKKLWACHPNATLIPVPIHSRQPLAPPAQSSRRMK